VDENMYPTQTKDINHRDFKPATILANLRILASYAFDDIQAHFARWRATWMPGGAAAAGGGVLLFSCITHYMRG
jgi:hypothetical protein